MKLLSEIETGKRVFVKSVRGRSSFRRRITEMGFVRGKEVFVVKNAPFRDPIEYRIMGYNVSLRRSEAALIEVVMPDGAETVNNDYHGTLSFEKQNQQPPEKLPLLKVVFVGNPNAGKTSLYNAITGKQEHVGNYSGVTVDAKRALIAQDNYEIEITDLPGTYSLSPHSPDEIFVRDHILKEHPDVVVNVVDASNLERNLYLTCQLIDMDIQVVLALNMFDELEKKGDVFNAELFARITGIPVVPTIGSKRQGTGALLQKVIEVSENKEPVLRHVHINYGQEIEQSVNHIQRRIWKADNYVREFSSRHIALRLLEKDSHTEGKMKMYSNATEILSTAQSEVARLESLLKDDSQTLIANARYGFIEGALKETYLHKQPKERVSASQQIDSILTGKYTGFPIFLLILWLMFQGTFFLGKFPAHWIELGMGWLGSSTRTWLAPGPVCDLLADGVIGGMGGVLVFLPNIVLLFFFISILEDTGYMARVAFIMDKLMHLIGLHGKSFIPLIMGFGCNVPAIMSTRTLENRSDRLLTMLIVPFMSCSARLPVYILIAGAIFPSNAGTIIFLIYLTGILVSVLSAILFKKTLFRSVEAPFVMELPPYRVPTLRSALRHMWHKAKQYLQKMGGIILWASIIVWFLSYFPRTSSPVEKLETHKAEIVKLQHTIEKTGQPGEFKMKADSLRLALAQTETQIADEQLMNSYIGRLGRFIEPALRPIGFDWKIGVSLLSGVVAKEVVVSTMGVLYGQTDENGNAVGMRESLPKQTFADGDNAGQVVFTPDTTLALLVFVLIYIPCIAVIAAIRRESGKWRWSLWSISYGTTLAWVLAFVVSKVAALFF